MSTENGERFTGFSPKTIDFLVGLMLNNNKTWFEQHRPEYKEYVLKPFQLLVAELSQTALAIDPLIETAPAVSKTISRIHRDTRFSKDKSPYRPNVWLSFKRTDPEWTDSPCFWFEVTPGSYTYGMGFYSATRETMDKFRRAIESDPDEFLDVIRPILGGKGFTVGGDEYKRPTGGSMLPDEVLPWYRKKNLYLLRERPVGERLFTREVADEIASGFRLSAGLYHYLYKAKSRPPVKGGF